MDVEKERKKRNEFLRSCLYIMIGCLYIGLQLGHAEYVVKGQTPAGQDVDIAEVFSIASKTIFNPLKCFPSDMGYLSIFLVAGLLICLYKYQSYLRNKNTMYGKEHGSASFNVDYKKLLHDYVMSPKILGEHFHKKYPTIKASGGRKQCKKKKFTAKETAYGKLMSQVFSKNVYLSLDTRLTQLNLNTIVLGGSGSGKSRFFVKPNLLQMNSSYVVTDPSGELMADVGQMLEKNGYLVKCFNIEDMSKSCRYNPFQYVYEDSDIPVMVKALTDNIEGPKKGGGDNKFWGATCFAVKSSGIIVPMMN